MGFNVNTGHDLNYYNYHWQITEQKESLQIRRCTTLLGCVQTAFFEISWLDLGLHRRICAEFARMSFYKHEFDEIQSRQGGKQLSRTSMS